MIDEGNEFFKYEQKFDVLHDPALAASGFSMIVATINMDPQLEKLQHEASTLQDVEARKRNLELYNKLRDVDRSLNHSTSSLTFQSAKGSLTIALENGDVQLENNKQIPSFSLSGPASEFVCLIALGKAMTERGLAWILEMGLDAKRSCVTLGECLLYLLPDSVVSELGAPVQLLA